MWRCMKSSMRIFAPGHIFTVQGSDGNRTGKCRTKSWAGRLDTSVDVLQHRAPKLGLRKYLPRRLPLSLQEIRDADRVLKADESLRSIARRLGTSHQVVNRAMKRWRSSTHIRERAKARALELARE